MNEDLIALLEMVADSGASDLEGVKKALLASGHGIDFREAYDGEGEMTPLLVASLFGHTALANWLIDQGADVTAASIYGRTCLHHMLDGMDDDDIDLMKRFVEAGANVNARDEGGYTPLHKAASGYTKSLQYLIPLVEDINVLVDDGLSPLYLAAVDGGYVECTAALLEAGADIGTINVAEVMPKCAHLFQN